MLQHLLLNCLGKTDKIEFVLTKDCKLISRSESECEGATVTAVSTVTIHDAPTTTVYLSASASGEASVSASGGESSLLTTTSTHLWTSTQYTTVYLSVVSSSVVQESTVPTTVSFSALSSSSVQDSGLPTTTITGYSTSTSTTTFTPVQSDSSMTTVTVQLTTWTTLLLTGPTTFVVTAHETKTVVVPSSSATGPLSFVITNSTTSWLGGIAPPSSVSYVVVTSAVTVKPVITPASVDHTRTTTLYSTVFGTGYTTITKAGSSNALPTPSTTASGVL